MSSFFRSFIHCNVFAIEFVSFYSSQYNILGAGFLAFCILHSAWLPFYLIIHGYRVATTLITTIIIKYNEKKKWILETMH